MVGGQVETKTINDPSWVHCGWGFERRAIMQRDLDVEDAFSDIGYLPGRLTISDDALPADISRIPSI